jgi:diaminopimelate epimerase
MMSPLAGLKIARMNGLGNEIIVLDLRGATHVVTPQEARAIHRAPRLHYDQLMVLHDATTPGDDAFVRIYNNDGSQSGSCGNGTRCVAYVMLRGTAREALKLETIAGPLEAWRLGEFSYRVDMGPPRLGWREIPLREAVADTRAIDVSEGPLSRPAVVSMGNPHAVFFVDDVASIDLPAFGPKLEHHAMFPERANISIAQVVARDHVRLRVWERGVGITRACGSAACATLVAAARRGLTDRRATLTLPGGDLVIDWRASDDHVLMTGPVELEFETMLDAAIFEGAA